MKKPIKYCKNIECEEAIEDYVSCKRLYCSDSCRNRDGYLRRMDENIEFITFTKLLKQNYLLLNQFAEAGIYKEPLANFERLGFNTSYLPRFKKFNIEGRNCYCYTIKDITFELENENFKNLVIHKSKHKINGRN